MCGTCYQQMVRFLSIQLFCIQKKKWGKLRQFPLTPFQFIYIV